MINISKKRKIRIEKVQIIATDSVKTFDIQLPSNVSKITAITVTCNT
ncbi:MAG: hypothetical protein JWO58_2836 [Chitinophagaceae bacterium]|nr:hypothetical protein [Chitinophagaceae bacterium]